MTGEDGRTGGRENEKTRGTSIVENAEESIRESMRIYTNEKIT